MKSLAMGAVLVLLASCSGEQQRAAFNNTFVANAVKAKLIGIDADAVTSVRVTVSGSSVTLTGTARSQGEKERYVAAARSVQGVTSVGDRLNVNPHLRGVRENSTDALLTARVSAAIAAQAGVNVFKLNVSSRAGTVTVRGRVPSQSIARTVEDTARGVPGVKRVLAHLTSTSLR